MKTSELTERISARLVQDITTGVITAGEHVPAQEVAARFGVSRTPVREALENLERNGVLERQPHRGFFVVDQIPDNVQRWMSSQLDGVEDEYQQLVDDWLTDRIDENVTEQFIRQRYGWTKTKVGDLLARAAREGWAERKEGYGWRLLPVAKTPEAFDEIYRFRMTIEPAAILEPTFTIDRGVLDKQRRIQERMLETAHSSVHDATLLLNGSLFHEEISKLSGNPYFLKALQQVNRMRRLMEYRADVNRDRLVRQCTEHLEILDLLESGDIIDASYKMRQHLSGALKRKSPVAWNWASEANDSTT